MSGSQKGTFKEKKGVFPSSVRGLINKTKQISKEQPNKNYQNPENLETKNDLEDMNTVNKRIARTLMKYPTTNSGNEKYPKNNSPKKWDNSYNKNSTSGSVIKKTGTLKDIIGSHKNAARNELDNKTYTRASTMTVSPVITKSNSKAKDIYLKRTLSNGSLSQSSPKNKSNSNLNNKNLPQESTDIFKVKIKAPEEKTLSDFYQSDIAQSQNFEPKTA